MKDALDVGEQLGAALIGLALNPFYYIGLLIVALLFRRQAAMQRRLFYARIHAPALEFVRVLGWGMLGGLAISLAAAGAGLVLNTSTLLWVWGTALALLIIRVRFFCLAYAAGVVALLHEAAARIPALRELQGVEGVISSLLEVHPPSLIALVALLHLVEALLVKLRGARMSSPLYVAGKRGRVVGAYHLQAFWAVPLLLTVPAMNGAGLAELLPWPFFFGGTEWTAGWTVMAFPALIGFTGMNIAELPEKRAGRHAYMIALFALVMGGLSVAAELWPVLAIAAALASPLLHEGMYLYHERKERKSLPFFTHGARGLKVLAVVPGSPAAELGIVPGETLLKVNGSAVSAKDELHAALRSNSAFCKLEVADHSGESKFMHRALFDGEHHQLGLILCPDEAVPYSTDWRSTTLWSLLSPGSGSKRRIPAPAAPAEERVLDR